MNRTARRALAPLLALIALCACPSRTPERSTSRSRPTTPAPAPPPPDAAPPLDTPPAPAPPRAFRLDPRHTGRSGYVLPRRPHIRARIATGARISSQAVVGADGRVVFGSHDGVVYAADPRAGRVAWRLATGDRVYSSPLVNEAGTVFVGSDADRFFAITRAGALDVALATDDDADTSAALASDGSLRFAAGRVLYAVEPDLTVRWRLEFGAKVYSSPALLADGTAIVGCQDDSVYAVDPAGAVRWHVSTGNDVDATPAVDDAGTVYVGSDDGTLYALASADGAVRWRRQLGGYIRAGVALGLDGSVVVGTFGPHPRVVAVDRASGAERWSVAVMGPPTRDYGVASAALVDREGRYAVGTPDDALLIIARDGTVDSRMPMPADVDSAPVLIADGLLAVGCDDGGMYLVGEEGADGGDAGR